MFNGRRQPSRGGTSRMNREVHVRICERLGVKFPGPSRQTRPCRPLGRGASARQVCPNQRTHTGPARSGQHGRYAVIALCGFRSQLRCRLGVSTAKRLCKIRCRASER